MHVNLIPPSRHRSRHRTNKTKLAFRRLATSTSLTPSRPLFRAIFSATLEPPSYQPMTRTSVSGTRVSIPQGREELPSLITEGAIVPLRRHERNLRWCTFHSPLDAIYRRSWEASRCMAIRNSTQRAFKKDSCWPPRLSDAARIPVLTTGGLPVLISPGFRAGT